MILRGRAIAKGRGEGELVLLEGDFSFLGGVDTLTGKLRGHGERNVAGRVLAFPRGRGSTVGSYTMYDMRQHGTLPAAIINRAAETIVTTGAVMSSVPLVDGIDLSLLREGDRVVVDGDRGTVELPDVELRRVVTAILRLGERVLLLRRSDKVSTFPGLWAGVSGAIEDESPIEAARRESREETGKEGLRLLGAADPIMVREGAVAWEVHPFLFSTEGGDVKIDWEHDEARWVDPSGARGLTTVPGLERVLVALGLLKE